MTEMNGLYGKRRNNEKEEKKWKKIDDKMKMKIKKNESI